MVAPHGQVSALSGGPGKAAAALHFTTCTRCKNLGSHLAQERGLTVKAEEQARLICTSASSAEQRSQSKPSTQVCWWIFCSSSWHTRWHQRPGPVLGGLNTERTVHGQTTRALRLLLCSLAFKKSSDSTLGGPARRQQHIISQRVLCHNPRQDCQQII